MTYSSKYNKLWNKDKSLLFLLRNMTDFRRNQAKIHDIETIIFIVLMALMSDYLGYRGIEDFINKKKKSLLRFLKPRKKKLPSRDTIRRVFINLDFEELNYIFQIWAKQHVVLNEKEAISFDGKVIKNTLPEKSHKFVNIVSMFAHKSKQVLFQGKVDHKSNEIPLVKQLIKELKLENKVLLGDALHIQKLTIKEIINSNNFYILNVKSNQKNLLKRIKFLMDEVRCPISKGTFENKGHGRYEKRIIEVFENDFQMDFEEQGFSKVKCLVKVTREVVRKKKTSKEEVYFISNLNENALKFNEYIRGHWSIENSLHWVKDVVFNEDKSCIKNGNSPQNFSLMRSLALNILRINGYTQITQATRLLSCEIKQLVKLLGGSY